MIEAYAFLAMFTVQVLALSVLLPAALARRARALLARYPAVQFPRLYPDGAAIIGRGLATYRALNGLVAAAGLLLLGWLYTYVRRPDWSDGPVEALVGIYLMLQLVPLAQLAFSASKDDKALRASFPEARRKATLRPRGLFDFVSPFTVSLAALGYLLFVGYVIYIDRDPFSGFAGAFVNIGIVTALYASMGLCVYVTLFGKKGNPLQTQADRMRSIEVVVRLCVYTCLGSVVFLSLNFTLVLLDLQRWEPFAQAAFNVAWALLLLAGINAPPDELNLDALRVGPAPSNAAIRGGAHAAGSSPGSAGP